MTKPKIILSAGVILAVCCLGLAGCGDTTYEAELRTGGPAWGRLGSETGLFCYNQTVQFSKYGDDWAELYPSRNFPTWACGDTLYEGGYRVTLILWEVEDSPTGPRRQIDESSTTDPSVPAVVRKPE